MSRDFAEFGRENCSSAQRSGRGFSAAGKPAAARSQYVFEKSLKFSQIPKIRLTFFV
jgi:hypothetical protein